jgi:DNA-nicking Smr family endonuclease
LRQGHFAWQAYLDLHGKRRQEAREAVERFLGESRSQRRRCVLIVHGRGLNSKDQIPVLKESLRVWLAQGRIARSVLAFCSAKPSDGGVGAVYVLLRK